MTKGELRTMIREILHEELNKSTTLKEAVEGPTYVIKLGNAQVSKVRVLTLQRPMRSILTLMT